MLMSAMLAVEILAILVLAARADVVSQKGFGRRYGQPENGSVSPLTDDRALRIGFDFPI